RCLLAPPRRHTDVRDGGVAGLAVLFHQDDVGSFPGPHEVALGSGLGQGVLDLRDEVVVKIAPQPAVLDIGINAGKWRSHEGLPRLGLTLHVSQDTGLVDLSQSRNGGGRMARNGAMSSVASAQPLLYHCWILYRVRDRRMPPGRPPPGAFR